MFPTHQISIILAITLLILRWGKGIFLWREWLLDFPTCIKMVGAGAGIPMSINILLLAATTESKEIQPYWYQFLYSSVALFWISFRNILIEFNIVRENT
jgi:hypothetical protein|tara:strand:- start:202 stop:498 length:297 start_codon:yes stop_codon:yes gene_type:complete